MPEEDYYGRNAENIEFTQSTADDITIYVAESGTETATTKYLNKGSLGTGLVIRPSNTVNLVQLGNKVFRNPITISTAGLTWKKKIKDFNIIVVRTTTTDTQIKILVL